jgi:prepilin-type N-terminal cleavage/methylation domain-containing protein
MKIKKLHREKENSLVKRSFFCPKSYVSNYSTPDSRTGGFTLIEVILTMTILAVGLVMILQLFSIGLRSSRTSCDYSTAVIYARGVMEELSISPVQGSGLFEDKFEWESEVLPYEGYEESLDEAGMNLLKLKVKVSWDETDKRRKFIQIVSLNAVESGDE